MEISRLHRLQYLIEVCISPLNYGTICMKGWALSLTFTLHFILRLMGGIRGLFRCLRICYKPLCLILVAIGISFFPLSAFLYNNNYYSIINMALFKKLYGNRFRSPIDWFEVSNLKTLDTSLVNETQQKVRFI